MVGLSITNLFSPMGLSLLISYWNIGLVFLCALIILRICTNDHGQIALHSIVKIALVIFLLGLANWGDYGMYGVILVMVFYYSIKQNWSCLKTFLWIGGLTVVLFGLLAGINGMLLQLPCALAVFLIYYVPNDRRITWKYFFYYFYPVHMLAIVLLRTLIIG